MEHMSEKADEADYYTEHVDDYEGDHEYYDNWQAVVNFIIFVKLSFYNFGLCENAAFFICN